MIKIRAGYEIIYDSPRPAPKVFMLHVHPSRVADLVTPDLAGARHVGLERGLEGLEEHRVTRVRLGGVGCLHVGGGRPVRVAHLRDRDGVSERVPVHVRVVHDDGGDRLVDDVDPVDAGLAPDLLQACGETFLKFSIAPAACAGWRGRADSLR